MGIPAGASASAREAKEIEPRQQAAVALEADWGSGRCKAAYGRKIEIKNKIRLTR
jgi:hypothetical protein